MIQNYQDGMAICRVFGAPDLFITFTCNPKWDEISEALLMEAGQNHVDRPDIVTRVFKMKINEFTGDVRRGEAFGKVHACMFILCFVFHCFLAVYCVFPCLLTVLSILCALYLLI
jgi:hypothetical protein